MNTTAKRIIDIVNSLPEQWMAEVLNFAEAAKQSIALNAPQEKDASTAFSDGGITLEDHRAMVERMRMITARQPMTYTTIKNIRDEARY